MSPGILLRPGAMALADWRAIYFGSAVALDDGCRAAVEAGAATIDAILARHEPVYGINTGFGKLASVRIPDGDLAQLQRNLVLSHAAGVGEPLAAPVVRLTMALKIANLGQGASGVRWATLTHLLACLKRGLVPVVPSQGSVGASGDLAPLAHLAAALIGEGEFLLDGARLPARQALARAGLAPIELAPKEGLALLNGTQVSTALALAGLFEAERVFQGALVTGALATDAARGSDGPFDARIQELRRHRGQIEVAAALRDLMRGSAIRASHLTDDDRIQDPYCLRCQPQVMGACLDLLRQAAATLETEANGVSDNPLVFAAEGEVISGGNFHAEPVAFAADMIALALCEIGSLGRAPRRHAGRSRAVRPAGVPDAAAGAQLRLHDPAGDRGGARLGEQAARLSGLGRTRSRPRRTRRTTSRWRRTARGASSRWRAMPRTSSRSSSSPRRKAATSTRRCARASRSSACVRSCARACRTSRTTG